MRRNRKFYAKKVYLFLLFLCLFTTVLSSQTPERFVRINNLRLLPNPFSPYSTYSNGEQGLRISFMPDVPAGLTFVWVTAKVYNLRGELVSTVKEREPIYSNVTGGKYEGEGGEIVFWWDGKTNFGRIAGNGRYLLFLQVSDTEEEQIYQTATAHFALIK